MLYTAKIHINIQLFVNVTTTVVLIS